MDLAQFFERGAEAYGTPNAVKWVCGPVTANWKRFDERNGDIEEVLAVIGKFSDGTITDTECGIELKSVMTGEDVEAAAAGAEDLDKIISAYLDENPQIVSDYGKGNKKAANSAIGFVMKSTGGKYSSSDIVDAVRRIVESRL